jgi:hypothetical protein
MTALAIPTRTSIEYQVNTPKREQVAEMDVFKLSRVELLLRHRADQ